MEQLDCKNRMLVALQLIKKQADDIHSLAKKQYSDSLGGKVYQQHGISQYHALADIARESSIIDFACNAITEQLELLDKLYTGQPIISEADAAEAQRIVAETESVSANVDTEELF